jgi:hypothetical protein
MAVIETQKQPRDIRVILFVAALIIGFLAVGWVVYKLVRPSPTRQVKLTGEQAKQAEASFQTPTPTLPPAPPLPQAQDPGPTLISLDLKQVTARQALAEVAKQAKASIKPMPGNPEGILAALTTPRSDVSITRQPFWPAMIDLCKKAQLFPSSEWNAPTQIAFQPAGAEQSFGPMKSVGSCLIILDSVTSNFDADLIGARQPTRYLSVQMRLFVEPKLSPYRISSVGNVETAVDENGTNLARQRNQWDDRQGGGPQSTWMREITCSLNFPANAGQRIAKLKGYASVAVAGPEQTKKIDDPLKVKNVDNTIDGTLIRMIELRKAGGPNSYYARMAGDVNSPVFRDYEKFNKVVSLFDTNGKEFDRTGGSWGGGRANTFEFGVNFTGKGTSEPKELRVTLPTQIKEIRVPFEFTDLPLPH